MLRPTIEKTNGSGTRSKDKNSHLMIVRNVAAEKSIKRFKLMGIDFVVPLLCTKLDETTYQFACNASAEVLQFAEDLKFRDNIDKTHIIDMIKLVSAAHCRNLVIGDLTSYNIGISQPAVASKIINMPHGKLWNGTPIVFDGIYTHFHAPEIHNSNKMTKASDIYSLAIHWIIAGTGQLIDCWHDMNVNAVRTEAIKLCKYPIQRKMLELDPDRRPSIELVKYAFASEREGSNTIDWSVNYRGWQRSIQNIFNGQPDAMRALVQGDDHSSDFQTSVTTSLPSILSYVNMELLNYMDVTSPNVVHSLDLVHNLLSNDPWNNFLPGDTGKCCFVVVHSLIDTEPCRRSGSAFLRLPQSGPHQGPGHHAVAAKRKPHRHWQRRS